METTFDKFKRITGINIYSFLTYFVLFQEEQYPKVVSFYTQGGELDSSFHNSLSILNSINVQVQLAIDNYSDELTTDTSMWSLLEIASEVDVKIDTINNSSKWFRSDSNMFGENNFKTSIVLSKNKDFETLSRESGNSNSESEWYRSKNYNNLREEDYTSEGGNSIIVLRNNQVSDFNITVGDTSGEKIYGKDISNDFEIDVDEGDFSILEYTDTFYQHVKTMVGMIKGSVPEFRNKGIDKAVLNNQNTFDFPIVFRQQSEVLRSDERISQVELANIVKTTDSKGLELNITSILNESINTNL